MTLCGHVRSAIVVLVARAAITSPDAAADDLATPCAVHAPRALAGALPPNTTALEDDAWYVNAGVDFSAPREGAAYARDVPIPVTLSVSVVPPPADRAAADALELCRRLDARALRCVALGAALGGGSMLGAPLVGLAPGPHALRGWLREVAAREDGGVRGVVAREPA